MESSRPQESAAIQLEKSRAAAMKLAQSSDAKKLMELLQAQGEQVRQATQAAAQGNPEQLVAIVERLAHSQEGADLLARMEAQAQREGLK